MAYSITHDQHVTVIPLKCYVLQNHDDRFENVKEGIYRDEQEAYHIMTMYNISVNQGMRKV